MEDHIRERNKLDLALELIGAAVSTCASRAIIPLKLCIYVTTLRVKFSLKFCFTNSLLQGIILFFPGKPWFDTFLKINLKFLSAIKEVFQKV